MLRNAARLAAPLTATLCATLAWIGGCGGSVVTLAETFEPAPPPLVDVDASTVEEPEAGLVMYCPSRVCPAGFETCEASRFPCDVDLQRDRQNCGACGNACPTGADPYECVEGRCVLQCGPDALDCDGFNENGCETSPGTNANCTGCGDTCPDPDNPCVDRDFPNKDYACGCGVGRLNCGGWCVDPKGDDENCGECENFCDPDGDGSLPPDNGYWGCANSQCGQPKCYQGYADCDGDPENGCEATLDTNENCAACGNACAAGQECKLDSKEGGYRCACPAGLTWCNLACVGPRCVGACVDLSSDLASCGACGVNCGAEAQLDQSQSVMAVCAMGVCKTSCLQGRADCNGNVADGCEVNTSSDPRNCGGCGNECDAVAGQACVGGRCVVEPCGESDGGETR